MEGEGDPDSDKLGSLDAEAAGVSLSKGEDSLGELLMPTETLVVALVARGGTERLIEGVSERLEVGVSEVVSVSLNDGEEVQEGLITEVELSVALVVEEVVADTLELPLEVLLLLALEL